MKRLISLPTTMLLPAVLLSIGLATPADANSFRGVNASNRMSVGSAANPRSAKDVYVNRGMPDYPQLSRESNERGKVGLMVSLTRQGKITDAVVQNSSGFPRLDDAAVQYMMNHWRYRANQDGQPMPVALRVDVNFTLQ